MGIPICFLAGESAERSWRYVVPYLVHDELLFHELIGRDGAAAGHSWQAEVDSLAATLHGRRPAHLVGLSAGATLALAFVAVHPLAVASLTLIEPAWSFLPLSDVERDYYARLDAILRGPASDARDGFRRLIVREDTPLSPIRDGLAAAEREREVDGIPSPLLGLTLAMQRHRVPEGSFAQFGGRVLIVIGGRSHPMWLAQSAALAAAFGRSRLEVFEDRHHLDPPQKSETERLVRLLEWAWGRSPDG